MHRKLALVVLTSCFYDVGSSANVTEEEGEDGIGSAPSPPHPSIPPGASLCTNTCQSSSKEYTYDAEESTCDDYADEVSGILVGHSACSFGTDCNDCGPRSICPYGVEAEGEEVHTECSEACAKRALARAAKGQPFCSWEMLSNGICEAACNNWECAPACEEAHCSTSGASLGSARKLILPSVHPLRRLGR